MLNAVVKEFGNFEVEHLGTVSTEDIEDDLLTAEAVQKAIVRALYFLLLFVQSCSSVLGAR